eukprot:TRINITY_DN56650_c0_g1_i1.p1 TRINITY_DN56650_c0_g1~~TRINITY_DN56650_c0_g1_i1.p1  ORF type:complete len:711 (-),score=125.95 TRINITY_DN56650_c0_g1_i1:238-2370(-)
MQLLTPPSSHREVVQTQAREQRAIAAERRADALTAQLEQERLKSAESKRQELKLAQRERDAYLANVRSLFQMSPEQPSRGEESGSSEAASGSSAARIKGGPPGRAALQHRVPPPVSVSAGSGGCQGGGSSSSSSSSTCGSARTNSGQKIHLPVTRKLPSSSKSGQPTWSEISTAAPSTAGGCEDDFEDLVSVFSGAGNLISPRTGNTPATVDPMSRADEPSELLQSLDLQVVDRLRASLKNWLETQDDTESDSDSPSLRARGKYSEPAKISPPLTDPLGGLPVFRSEAKLQGGPLWTGNHQVQTGSDDLLGESLLSLSASDHQAEAMTIAADAVPFRQKTPVVTAQPPRVSNAAATRASAPRPGALVVAAPGPEAACEAQACGAALQFKAPSRAARPAEERKRETLETKTSSTTAAPAHFQVPSRVTRPAEENKQETSEPKNPSKAEAPARATQYRSSSSGPSVNRALPSKSPAPVQTIRAPPPSMKAILTEEEALQQSLMRLEFLEMKRQFSGKEPAWNGPQVMSETFMIDPHRESKLKASLERLGNALSDLQARNEVRVKEHEQANVDVITAPPSQAEHCPPRDSRMHAPHAAVSGKRHRPRSASVGRVAYGSRSRAGGSTAAPPVAPTPNPHSGVRAASAGRCNAARPPDSGGCQGTSQDSCQAARAAVPPAGTSQENTKNAASAAEVGRQRRASMQAGRALARPQQ